MHPDAKIIQAIMNEKMLIGAKGGFDHQEKEYVVCLNIQVNPNDRAWAEINYCEHYLS